MMAKINSFSIYRIVLLALAVLLTGLGILPTATAGCTPGQTRTITVNVACCDYPSVKVTKQKQICCADNTWMNDGGPFCAAASVCAI
jgi:hypothetical protein